MSEVHEARIEAAARAMAEWDGLDFAITDNEFKETATISKDAYRNGATAALAAADAVVTVEMIAETVAAAGRVDDRLAREIAEAVQRLYRGEEA